MRILQEALTNIIKHAGASRATLIASADSVGIEIRVIDDGHGRQREPSTAGMERGLPNMRQRAERIGGQVDVVFAATGTCVALRMPLSRT